jgi:hypothetical protein
MMFALCSIVMANWFRPLVTPYKSEAKLMARTITTSKSTYIPNEVFDAEIDLQATYDNPFDSNDVNVRIIVENPDQTVTEQRGFFTMSGSRDKAEGKERIQLTKPHWRARLSFAKPGQYRISALVKDRSGTSLTNSLTITIEDKQPETGFVRISETDHRYFQLSTGESYYPIGLNLCWGGDEGTFAYDRWLDEMQKNGMNFFRLWLSPAWATFATELGGKSREGRGLGVYSLENLWKLDYVLDAARKRGMKVKLCFESYNILRDKDASNYWEQTPHNAENGGPLVSPQSFWTSPEISKLFKQKLDYLVARYGADPAVFAWEFWNEVDLTRNFPAAEAKDWHQEMATYLRKIDPYKHLISTSFANSMGTKEIDLLPEMDFTQTHNYNSPDVLSQVAIQQSRKGSWGKPHYVSEIGADSGGPRGDDDPKGYQIHDPLWLSICMGSSASAQPWWWDNYIEPKQLFPIFGVAANFVKGIDWQNEQFRQTTPKLKFIDPTNAKGRKDLSIGGGPVEWKESEFNRPRTVTVSSAGAKGQLPLAGNLHGLKSHPDWHNPVTFNTEFDRPTVLEVSVGGVSGYGGAALAIEINGSRYLTRNFDDPDGEQKTDTLNQYGGTYRVTIPAGKRKVVVKNIGTDWMNVSYRFKDALPATTPPIVTWGTVGNTVALAWLRHEDRTWRRICALKESTKPVPATSLQLSGLASGNWRIELWDTWSGKIISSTTQRVKINGLLNADIPIIEHDIALKAVKVVTP